MYKFFSKALTGKRIASECLSSEGVKHVYCTHFQQVGFSRLYPSFFLIMMLSKSFYHEPDNQNLRKLYLAGKRQ
jgi:hypothetical protein